MSNTGAMMLGVNKLLVLYLDEFSVILLWISTLICKKTSYGYKFNVQIFKLNNYLFCIFYFAGLNFLFRW